jgi:hypothetical protein
MARFDNVATSQRVVSRTPAWGRVDPNDPRVDIKDYVLLYREDKGPRWIHKDDVDKKLGNGFGWKRADENVVDAVQRSEQEADITPPGPVPPSKPDDLDKEAVAKRKANREPPKRRGRPKGSKNK